MMSRLLVITYVVEYQAASGHSTHLATMISQTTPIASATQRFASPSGTNAARKPAAAVVTTSTNIGPTSAFQCGRRVRWISSSVPSNRVGYPMELLPIRDDADSTMQRLQRILTRQRTWITSPAPTGCGLVRRVHHRCP
jgi:hypothetical protein